MDRKGAPSVATSSNSSNSRQSRFFRSPLTSPRHDLRHSSQPKEPTTEIPSAEARSVSPFQFRSDSAIPNKGKGNPNLAENYQSVSSTESRSDSRPSLSSSSRTSSSGSGGSAGGKFEGGILADAAPRTVVPGERARGATSGVKGEVDEAAYCNTRESRAQHSMTVERTRFPTPERTGRASVALPVLPHRNRASSVVLKSNMEEREGEEEERDDAPEVGRAAGAIRVQVPRSPESAVGSMMSERGVEKYAAGLDERRRKDAGASPLPSPLLRPPFAKDIREVERMNSGGRKDAPPASLFPSLDRNRSFDRRRAPLRPGNEEEGESVAASFPKEPQGTARVDARRRAEKPSGAFLSSPSSPTSMHSCVSQNIAGDILVRGISHGRATAAESAPPIKDAWLDEARGGESGERGGERLSNNMHFDFRSASISGAMPNSDKALSRGASRASRYDGGDATQGLAGVPEEARVREIGREGERANKHVGGGKERATLRPREKERVEEREREGERARDASVFLTRRSESGRSERMGRGGESRGGNGGRMIALPGVRVKPREDGEIRRGEREREKPNPRGELVKSMTEESRVLREGGKERSGESFSRSKSQQLSGSEEGERGREERRREGKDGGEEAGRDASATERAPRVNERERGKSSHDFELRGGKREIFGEIGNESENEREGQSLAFSISPSVSRSLSASLALHSSAEAGERVELKIGLLGDCQVGKTSLVAKFVDNLVVDDYVQTLGVNCSEKRITCDSSQIVLSLWDLGGHRQCLSTLPLACNDATSILFVFDLTRRSTLHSVKQWYLQARQYNMSALPVLVGTKFDAFVGMAESHKEAVIRQARSFALAMNAPLIFSSISHNVNICRIFKIILSKVFNFPCFSVPITSNPGEPVIEF